MFADSGSDSGSGSVKSIPKNELNGNMIEMEDVIQQSLPAVNNTSKDSVETLIETQIADPFSKLATENQTSLVSISSSEACTCYKGPPIIYFYDLPCNEGKEGLFKFYLL